MAKTAARERPGYRCSECGLEATRWVGRCPECQAWGTLAEVGARPGLTVAAGPVSAPARPIREVAAEDAAHRPTGIAELDRVLGGGLVPGSVVLLAGEPGVGKSTLLMAAAARVADSGRRALVVTGEESAAQVRMRAGRIDAMSDQLYLAAETELSALLGHVDAVRPELLIVDSVQTMAAAAVDGSVGGLAQGREGGAALTGDAKERGIATVLVGHVTKDGGIAGPRMLEHVVDVVLHFEGDRHSRLRLLRTGQKPVGAADEVGCFDLTDDGIVGLSDPSHLFMNRRESPVPGTCVTVTMEGRRALASELQALVGLPQAPTPRRAASGLDGARVAMLLAVLERRAGVKLADREVYAATVGGVRLTDPAADLALALAIGGAWGDPPVPGGGAAIGEVGLAGEIRPVSAVRARATEAARLGFQHILVPPGSSTQIDGVRVVEVGTLVDAMRCVGIARS